MLEGLDQVNWKHYRHSYGIATDVPGYFRQMLSDDEPERERAFSDLITTINHQGDIMSATAQAVPFLIELLVTDNPVNKSELLLALKGMAMGCTQHAIGKDNFRDYLATYQNIGAGLKMYLHLLTHQETSIRFYTAQLLGALVDHSQYIRLPLWRAIEKEQHADTLAEMIFHLGKLIPQNWQPKIQAVMKQYAEIFENIAASHPEPRVKIAAALGWVKLQNRIYDMNKRPPVPAHLPPILAEALVHPVPNNPDLWSDIDMQDDVLSALGKLGIFILAEALTIPDIDSQTTHLIGREMVDTVFRRKSPSRAGVYQIFSMSWSPYENRSMLREGKWMYEFHPLTNVYFRPDQPLSEPQKFVLTTIANNDLFWEMPTNLFSFFYGLPDSREELRQLIAKS